MRYWKTISNRARINLKPEVFIKMRSVVINNVINPNKIEKKSTKYTLSHMLIKMYYSIREGFLFVVANISSV